MDEMTKVWELAALTDLATDEKHKAAKALVVWYYESWLPIAIGRKYWEKHHRWYNKPIDSCEIKKKNDDGEWIAEKKVLVTITSEAFGWLTYDNCRDKWLNLFRFRETNGKKAKIPVKDEAGAEKYRPKYTESNCGQVKFGGWKDEAFDQFERYKTMIKNIRSMDKDNNYTSMQAALKLVRDVQGITEDTPKTKSKRGRKKKDEAELPPSKRLAITEIEE